MQFPGEVQCALLFDGRVPDLEGVVRSFTAVAEAREGIRLNLPESRPGIYYRLFGGNNVTVSFEHVPGPANPEAFTQALGSTVTGLMCSDARERITRHTSMVLVTVTHGVMGNVFDDPKIAAMLGSIGMAREGASLSEFLERLTLCQLASRIVCEEIMPTLVHWTQSNQLYPGEVFDELAALPAPSPLHVHPWLFGARAGPGEKAKVGIRTFGARHFIGGEIVVEPHELPFAATFDVALVLVRLAIAENGYIIPDNDTFGDEGRSVSYRCTHRGPDETGVPIYELTPLLHAEHGFRSDGLAPMANVIDDRMPPPSMMPADQDDKAALVNEWREKRTLAEGAGGRFEVRGFDTPPPRPTPPGGPRRAVFGRKGL